MPDISGSRIGGRLEDMDLIQSDLDATGNQAAEHATASAARVDRLQAEVADVTAQMKSDFMDLASQLSEMVARSNASLDAADWDGRSRGAASAANAQFASDIDTVLGAAQQGADRMHHSLLAQVTSFFDEVSGSFAQVMHGIEENYGTLAMGTRQYAASLAEQDSVAIQYG
jgi:uncharacterized phage infection (PIP) family protein YhgE